MKRVGGTRSRTVLPKRPLISQARAATGPTLSVRVATGPTLSRPVKLAYFIRKGCNDFDMILTLFSSLASSSAIAVTASPESAVCATLLGALC